ncbi:MAG: hypothetical protein H0U65_11790 [Rubrobacter sp.]|jgi:hypothetical protein|nr:hypothetical protein [Rubrobacter sp.]
MDGLTFEHDSRNTDPNQSGHRRARFRQGWLKAVEGDVYGDAALKELKWDNLGHRLGKIFGGTSEEMIEAQYDWRVRQQKNAKR